MNLNWTDPRLIAVAVAVLVIIAVIAGCTCENAESRRRACARNSGLNTTARSWHMGQLSRSKTGGSREADRETQNSRSGFDGARTLLEEWQGVQSRFVDSPKGAVTEADDLVSSVMKARGYPVADFDQRAADISVDHPRVVENYRLAHQIAFRVGKDAASTEDLRTAMIHYRSLFEELVQVPTIVETKRVA